MPLSPGAKSRLHSKPNVHMVWTAKDGTVKVGVHKKVARNLLGATELVPESVEGKKTDVVVVSPITAPRRPPVSPQAFTSKQRPCPGGFSVGHRLITAGTLGLWVKKNGEDFILSNNHVLANSNEGVAGDTITQPGPYDLDGLTTDPGNWIGRLSEFVVINHEGGGGGGGGELPDGCLDFLDNIPWPPMSKKGVARIEQGYPNKVDAALAEDFGESAAVDPGIHRIGRPTSIRPAILGETLIKCGRTTEVTEDPVEADDLSVQVQYGSFVALFDDQLMVVSQGQPFSQGGDSGSAVLAKSDKALVGLLFAGGTMEDGTEVTIVNKIEHVQNLLGFTL